MADFSYVRNVVYNADGSFSFEDTSGGTVSDLDDDNPFESGDEYFTAVTWEYQGTITRGGVTAPVFENTGSGGQYIAFFGSDPGSQSGIPLLGISSGPFMFCLGAGTLIATPEGEREVEDLAIGDRIRTSVGKIVSVKWIGRQTVQKLFAGPRMQPVRIRAGALGDGLPHTNLTVTADHGMIIDGLVINAAALINGSTIDWVPMAELPEWVTYYHVETEDHDVILANGAPAETFVDFAGRQAFDNYQEYVDLYGAERIIPEMPHPRISARRLVPAAIKARLGIVEAGVDFDGSKIA